MLTRAEVGWVRSRSDNWPVALARPRRALIADGVAPDEYCIGPPCFPYHAESTLSSAQVLKTRLFVRPNEARQLSNSGSARPLKTPIAALRVALRECLTI